jgi:ELWxxDGT repeat protein
MNNPLHTRQNRFWLPLSILLIFNVLAYGQLLNPSLVKDIVTGANGSGPERLTALTNSNKTVFIASAEGFGRELWATDGTEAGTSMIKEFAPGIGSPEFSQFVEVNGSVYFSITFNTTPQKIEFWKTGGTAASTILLNEYNPPTSNGVGFGAPFLANNFVYFPTIEYMPNGTVSHAIWRTNGFPSGTVYVGVVSSSLSNALVPTYYHKQGQPLFVVNGSRDCAVPLAQGSIVVVDSVGMRPPIPFGSPTSAGACQTRFLGVQGNHLHFLQAASLPVNSTTKTTLFKLNTEGVKTVVIDSFGLHGTSNTPLERAVTPSWIYFFWNSQMWKTNGTVVGTQPITNRLIETEPFGMFVHFADADTVYFSDIGSRSRNWRVSGGTPPVYLFEEETPSHKVSFFRKLGGIIYSFGPDILSASPTNPRPLVNVKAFNRNGATPYTKIAESRFINLFENNQLSTPNVGFANNNILFAMDNGTQGIELGKLDLNPVINPCDTDRIAPVFQSCPQNINLITAGSTATATWTTPTATDNCTTPPSVSSNYTSGSVFGLGTTTVTYTATDAKGNTARCSFTIQVVNSPAACPKDYDLIGFAAGCSGTTRPTLTGTMSFFNENIARGFHMYIETSPNEFDRFTAINGSQLGIQNATFTQCGSADGWWYFTASGAKKTLASVAPKETGYNIRVKNVGVDSFLVEFSTTNGGLTLKTNRVTNRCNSCFPTDNTPPSINCPTAQQNYFLDPNVTYPRTESAEQIIRTLGITNSDNCGGTNGSYLSFINTTFPINPLNTYGIDIIVRDSAGNQRACSFQIRTSSLDGNSCNTDTVKPIIANCPQNISLVTASTTATANWTAPTITDNCSAPTVSISNLSGSSFPIGTTTVTYTATDAKGNFATCRFNVIVTQQTTGGICKQYTASSTNSICNPATWQPYLVRNGADRLISDNLEFKETSAGTATLKGVLRDANWQIVNVDLTFSGKNTTATAQKINCLPPSVNTANWVFYPTVSGTIGTTTINAATHALQIGTGANTQNINDLGGYAKIGNGTISYDLAFRLTNETTVACDNGGGNSCTNNTLNFDGIDDNIVTPQVVLANANFTLEATFTSTATATSCSGNFKRLFSFDLGNASNRLEIGDCAGELTLFYFISGGNAQLINIPNTNTLRNGNWHHVAIVKFNDILTIYYDGISVFSQAGFSQINPVSRRLLIGRWATQGENWQGNIDEVRVWNYAVSTGDIQTRRNCQLAGTETGLVLYYPFNQGIAGGANTSITQALDKTANANHAALNLFSLQGATSNFVCSTQSLSQGCTTNNPCTNDQTPPVFANIPAPVTVSCAQNVPALVNPTATDNCTAQPTVVVNIVNATGRITRTWTATDGAGNSTTAQQIITIQDNTPPVLTNCPSNLTVSTSTTCGTATWSNPTATDNCGTPSVSASYTTNFCFPMGATTVRFTATDGANNTATCSFTVTVNSTNTGGGTCKKYTALSTNSICNPATWTPFFLQRGNERFIAESVEFKETSGNLATLKGTLRDANWQLVPIDLTFSAKNLTAAPTIANCLQPRPVYSDWVYYGAVTGTIGLPSGVVNINNIAGNLQVGTGANTQNVNDLGGFAPISGSNTAFELAFRLTNGTTVACDSTTNPCASDTQAPVFSNCPSSNLTASTATSCTGVPYTVPTATDNCSTPSVTPSHSNTFCFPIGTTVVTYTARDAANNTSICRFNVVVSSAPNGCPIPTNIRAIPISPTSVRLICQRPAGAPQVEWEVRRDGAPGTLDGNRISGVITNLDTIISFTSAPSRYMAFVRTHCASLGGISAWSEPVSFILTDCTGGVRTNLNETFEGAYTVYPDCWSNNIYRPRWDFELNIDFRTAGTGTLNNVTRRATFYRQNTADSGRMMLVSPELSNLSAGTHRLRFKAANRWGTIAGNGLLQVGTVSDRYNDATFVPFGNAMVIPNNNFTEFTVDFSTYRGNGKHLAFRYINGGGDTFLGLELDDVIWEQKPTTGGSGLQIAIESTPPQYRAWTPLNYRISLKNNGLTVANNVKVVFEPAASQANGGTATASLGSYQDFCAGGTECREWTIPSLAAGATATLDLPRFVLNPTGDLVSKAKLLTPSVSEATVTVTKAITQGLVKQKVTQLIPVVIQGLQPNPTDRDLTLELESLSEKEVTFEFSDLAGKVIHTEKRALTEGVQKQVFDVFSLPQGVYLIQISSNALRNQPVKFVKM